MAAVSSRHLRACCTRMCCCCSRRKDGGDDLGIQVDTSPHRTDRNWPRTPHQGPLSTPLSGSLVIYPGTGMQLFLALLLSGVRWFLFRSRFTKRARVLFPASDPSKRRQAVLCFRRRATRLKIQEHNINGTIFAPRLIQQKLLAIW